jgi:hypothetical protein
MMVKLLLTIKGCEKAAVGVNNPGWPEVRIAVAYSVVMIVISLFLFPLIWEE